MAGNGYECAASLWREKQRETQIKSASFKQRNQNKLLL